MTIDLYHHEASGPCRSVRLVAAAIGIDLNLIFIDILRGKNLEPEFVKMNPQHAIPTLDDNSFYLAESRAICTYLVDKYGKDDSLYPKDPQKRAIINQRLFFDAEKLYKSFFDYYILPIRLNAARDPSILNEINKAFWILEEYLENKNYVAGEEFTIADIVLLSSVSNFSVFDHDISIYKNTSKWFSKVKSKVPKYKEINEEGLRIYKDLIDQVLSGKFIETEENS